MTTLTVLFQDNSEKPHYFPRDLETALSIIGEKDTATSSLRRAFNHSGIEKPVVLTNINSCFSLEDCATRFDIVDVHTESIHPDLESRLGLKLLEVKESFPATVPFLSLADLFGVVEPILERKESTCS